MAISVELLLEVIWLLAFVFLVGTVVRLYKSSNSKEYRIAQFLACIAFVAIDIVTLTTKLLNGESFVIHLFVTYLWLLFAVLSAFHLDNK